MPVMQVGIVGMFVDHRCVPVPMRVRFVDRIVWPMGMLVMFIVPVPMLVHHLGVPVLVLMLFGDMQIDAERHQSACNDQASVMGSPNMAIASTAPTKGAVEKYAPVRAVPRWRKASTNKTKLKP